MDELTLTTPSLLFSAVSLLMLAYTNRFITYAQVIRNLKDEYMKNPTLITAGQIKNLRKRLYLTRRMQVQGISSLFLCVVTMFLIYIHLNTIAVYIFALALILLILSLATSVWEIYISVNSLDIYLSDMVCKEDKEK